VLVTYTFDFEFGLGRWDYRIGIGSSEVVRKLLPFIRKIIQKAVK
jgi:hypothetical protein